MIDTLTLLTNIIMITAFQITTFQSTQTTVVYNVYFIIHVSLIVQKQVNLTLG